MVFALSNMSRQSGPGDGARGLPLFDLGLRPTNRPHYHDNKKDEKDSTDNNTLDPNVHKHPWGQFG